MDVHKNSVSVAIAESGLGGKARFLGLVPCGRPHRLGSCRLPPEFQLAAVQNPGSTSVEPDRFAALAARHRPQQGDAVVAAEWDGAGPATG
jgi:hypothetical protein